MEVRKIFIILTSLNTLASSFIWGVNTLFLLDAGLTNAQAFGANALFTLGVVIFEVPTGVIADTSGRRLSFLLGTLTLIITTVVYYYFWLIKADFLWWGLISLFLGLGFTFFSGAVEAWLVDALAASEFDGELEDVFAQGQLAAGISMLVGSTLGGFAAQLGDLGTPYLLRSGFLIFSFLTALYFMKDEGFIPRKSENPLREINLQFKNSIELGLRQKEIRWMLFTSPFVTGTAVYAFYAAQPFLLELYGNTEAYWIAGLASSLVALAQIAGSFLVLRVRKFFQKRSHYLFTTYSISAMSLITIYFASSFWSVFALIACWALVGMMASPVRQAYLNKCLPSDKRATLLSFDGLLGSTGGVASQPTLGRVADLYGYGASLFIGGIFQSFSLIFLVLVKKEKSSADQL